MNKIIFDKSTPKKVINSLTTLLGNVSLNTDKPVVISYSSPAKPVKGAIHINNPRSVEFILNKPKLLKSLGVNFINIPKGETLLDSFSQFIPGLVLDPILPIKYVDNIENLKVYFEDYGGRLYPCLIKYHNGELTRREVTFCSDPICKKLKLDFCSLIMEDDTVVDVLPEVSIETLIKVLKSKGII